MTSEDDELAGQFIEWMAESMVEMEELVAGLQGSDTLPLDTLETLYGITHNLKGMGTSFSFDLITEVGTLLCVYLRAIEQERANYELSVLDALLKALRIISDHKITGDGGERGTVLMARLNELISAQEKSGDTA